MIEQLNNCHTEVNKDSPNVKLKNCYSLCNWTIHFQNKFAKFLGVCNDIDNQLVRCLKRERQARAAANRVKAAERQARIKERLLSS